MLDEREALLRAIFDALDDDLPRLVYADWLDEHAEELVARAIRLSIACVRASGDAERDRFRNEFLRMKSENPDLFSRHDGLFRNVVIPGRDEPPYTARLATRELVDFEEFRSSAVERPWLFGVRRLELRGGSARINDARPFDTVAQSVALRNIVSLDLAGDEEPIVASTVTDDGGGLIGYPTYETRLVPTISLAGVEVLARHRLCKRMTELDLTNNNLGNDALRCLVRSPYLDNLRRLQIGHGNNFRGRVWQLLIERFGEQVVS